jgi:hypothetical protein
MMNSTSTEKRGTHRERRQREPDYTFIAKNGIFVKLIAFYGDLA